MYTMSAKPVRDEKPLLSRCLAIVFKEKRSKKHAEIVEATTITHHEVEKPGPGPGPGTGSGTTTGTGTGTMTVSVTAQTQGSTPTPSPTRPTPKSGKEIFESFVSENRTCYWNPHLEESVRNLKYIGCLHPSTVLVGGRDIYMDTVKAAWARKVLRPPVNFTIQRAGEKIVF